MHYISFSVGGGELFERIVDDDFDLKESDCIRFVKQICDGIRYMHSKSIVHLDLKPENVMCVSKHSNQVTRLDCHYLLHFCLWSEERQFSFCLPTQHSFKKRGFMGKCIVSAVVVMNIIKQLLFPRVALNLGQCIASLPFYKIRTTFELCCNAMLTGYPSD